MFVCDGEHLLNLDYIDIIDVKEGDYGTYSLRFFNANSDNLWYMLGKYEDEFIAREAREMLINRMKENPSLIDIRELLF